MKKPARGLRGENIELELEKYFRDKERRNHLLSGVNNYLKSLTETHNYKE